MKKLCYTIAAMTMVTVLASNLVVATNGVDGGRSQGGFGGRPSFDTLLDMFDNDDSGDLTENEVPSLPWSLYSPIVDADDNGVVTREEFESVQGPRGN